MRISLAVLVALLLATRLAAAGAGDPSFRSTMDALAAVLAVVLPDALQQGDVDEARSRRLRDGIRSLQSMSHALSAMKAADLPDDDPTLGILLGELGRSVDDVSRSKADRLPQTALAVTSACIACHTRTRGPTVRVALAPVDPSLPADVRADIFAATRRFDEARAAYRAVVFDETFASKEPWRWERAVRRALALEIRVADDAKAAAELVDQVLATEAAEALWSAADAWKRDIAAWRREQTERAAEAPFARAARLMNEAMQQRRPAGDASAEVLLLRATAGLHTLLGDDAGSLSKDRRAQALAWLGLAYETLTELDVWGLFLLYDAACVEAAPHTPLASTCFTRYERAALELFSGNGGAPLPPDVKRKVEALRALSR